MIGWGDMSIKTLVRQYLSALQESGAQQQLPVDEAARAVLRAWMLAKKRGVAPAAAVREPSAPMAEADTKAVKRAAEGLYEVLEHESEPKEQPNEENEVFFRPGGQTVEEAWENARKLLPRWAPLVELKTLRETVVWGEGSRVADIMFVGEATNYQDEVSGRPFSGEAGGKLDGMLKAMGLTRQEVYITQMVKFRPKLPRQTINDRTPTPIEIRRSVPVLQFETALVKPKVIVALGVVAARGLLQRGELPLAAYQQLPDATFCGIPVVVTHHPRYLLLTSVLEERRRLWEEMLRVMEMAHLPISDKQRGYFLPKA